MAIPALTPVEENIAFHMAIGQAVSQWAHVENGLFNICVTAFKGSPPKVLGASFHAIDNFRTKLGFTDSAIQQSKAFSEVLADWAIIRDHVRGLSTTRNKIAHCRTIVYPDAPAGRRYAIVPISYKGAKKQSAMALAPSGSLCVKDIDLASRQFSRASNCLLGLMAKVQGHHWPPGESSQQEPQPRSLVEIRSLIDAVRLQRG